MEDAFNIYMAILEYAVPFAVFFNLANICVRTLMRMIFKGEIYIR